MMNDADVTDDADTADDADNYNMVIGIALLKTFSCARKNDGSCSGYVTIVVDVWDKSKAYSKQ